jgi:mRNA-degrading endonuclease RelE of RelBE toxin-antitoxin system
MSYEIEGTNTFRSQAKKLIKKYHSLRDELAALGKELQENPTLGKSLGNNTYKIRLSVKSKGKGKSGGLRLITYVVIRKEIIFLLGIYDKSEMASIPDKVIRAYTQEIDEYLKGR